MTKKGCFCHSEGTFILLQLESGLLKSIKDLLECFIVLSILFIKDNDVILIVGCPIDVADHRGEVWGGGGGGGGELVDLTRIILHL